MSDDRKSPVWPWIVALVIGLPVMYVASSGPMQMVSRSSRMWVGYDTITHRPASVQITERGTWWYYAYAPLCWTSEQPWGEPLFWYWNQFKVHQSVHFE
jgi:hypothetical protein